MGRFRSCCHLHARILFLLCGRLSHRLVGYSFQGYCQANEYPAHQTMGYTFQHCLQIFNMHDTDIVMRQCARTLAETDVHIDVRLAKRNSNEQGTGTTDRILIVESTKQGRHVCSKDRNRDMRTEPDEVLYTDLTAIERLGEDEGVTVSACCELRFEKIKTEVKSCGDPSCLIKSVDERW